MRRSIVCFAAATVIATCSIVSLAGVASADARTTPAPSDVQEMFQGGAVKQVQGQLQNLHQNPQGSLNSHPHRGH
ncbi:MAG: hypothetical protein QG608_1802 [Actinomycetota bacterium]|nr:hypothetical protein [Actinomycetota bacterium]